MSSNTRPATPSERRAAGLTRRVISDVLSELQSKGELSRLGETRLARAFVGAFFDGNPYRATFAELRETFTALWSPPEEVPTNEQDFATWLRKDVLWMSELPRDALLDLYEEASSDLVAIERNIEKCERKIGAIGKPARTDHDGPDRKFYEYYRKMNIAAQDEILRVLRGGIRSEALRRSRRKIAAFANPIDFHVAWSFRWFPESFDPDSFSELANKFGGIGIQDFQLAEHLYKTDGTGFDRFLDRYFEIHTPVQHIRDAIPTHHRLLPRKDVLEAAVGAFERNQLELFTATASLQVEGIFEDCCLDLGGEREALLTQALTSKVEAVSRVADLASDYAYYAFRFPVLRNQIAHGRILTGDRCRTARLLLLDLRAACDILRTLPSDVNRTVALLRAIPAAGPTATDLVKFASLMDSTGKVPILHDCYGLRERIEKLQMEIASNEFWNSLVGLTKCDSPELSCGIKKIATALKKVPVSRSAELLQILGHMPEASGRFPLCQRE